MGQNRYASLKLAFPDKAEAFYEKLKLMPRNVLPATKSLRAANKPIP